MKRTWWILVAAALAAASVFLAPQAMAQSSSDCAVAPAEEPEPTATAVPVVEDETFVGVEFALPAETNTQLGCADAVAYPGPFTNAPVAQAGPFAAPDLVAAPSAVTPNVAAEQPAAELALSGSEATVLAYLGTGLLAFGAVALGVRRNVITR